MGEAVKRINIRCSEEEYDIIQQAAEKANLTITAYLLRSAVAIARGKGEIKTEEAPKQEWAGNFGPEEIAKMSAYLMRSYVLMNEYRANCVAMMWVKAMETVQDAEAQDTKLYPNRDNDKNARFIQWVRDNPETPVEVSDEVAEAVGISQFELGCIRSDLGWDLTQYRGMFDVAYPWRQLG